MRATLNCIVVKYTWTGAGCQWTTARKSIIVNHTSKQAPCMYYIHTGVGPGTGTSEFFVSPHVLVRVVPG